MIHVRMSVFRVRLATEVLLVLLTMGTTLARADWPQFRGPNSSGIAVNGKGVPTEFAPGKNELWNVEVGPGHSSPCIVGDAIFLTAFDESNKRLEVVCVGRSDGNVRWRFPVSPDQIETGHPSFNPASSTPAADDQCVVAYFGSYGLICLDHHGVKRWEIKMPLTKSYAGNATSPVIVGDRVILYRGNHVDHFLLAVNKETGEELWKVQQEEPFVSELACTSCPIVIDDKLIVHSARSVQAVEISSGKQIWVAKCATTATSTPILAGKEVIVAAWNKMGEPALRPSFPTFEQLIADHDKDDDNLISKDELPRLMIFHRPDGAEAPQNGAAIRFVSVDKSRDGEITEPEWGVHMKQLEAFRSHYETHGILAIPIDSEGLVDAEKVRTLEQQSIPEVPSPIFHEGVVYFVKNGGVLTSLSLETGDRLARIRTRGRGTHYASPIVAGGKMFSTAGDGTITVLTLEDKPEILAVNEIGENTYATPAVVDGVLYVRTHDKLYAFGTGES